MAAGCASPVRAAGLSTSARNDPRVGAAVRLFLALAVLGGTGFLLRWLVIPKFGLPWRLQDAAALCAALPFAYWAWRQSAASMPRTAGMSALLGAVIGGSVATCLGLAVSVLLDANQGPLLALFVLAPAGAVIGAFGGARWWNAHSGDSSRTMRH